MWHDIENKRMEIGIGSVDSKRKCFTFGAKTVKACKLDRFKTVTPMNNDSPGLVAFQFYEDDRGLRALLCPRGRYKTSNVNCQPVLKKACAAPGKYKMRKEVDGFITIDFTRGKPSEFAPRKKR